MTDQRSFPSGRTLTLVMMWAPPGAFITPLMKSRIASRPAGAVVTERELPVLGEERGETVEVATVDAVGVARVQILHCGDDRGVGEVHRRSLSAWR